VRVSKSAHGVRAGHPYGGAVTARASHERPSQRMEELEKRLAQAEWRSGINRAG
jgi:hypothetical protein